MFCFFWLVAKGIQLELKRTMLLLVSSLLLAVVVVRSSDTDDLRSLVESLIDQNAKLTAANAKLEARVDGLHAQLMQVQQRGERNTAKLESQAGRRRLSTAVSTQRRGLSSGTCADPNAPQLHVEGIGSFADDIVIANQSVKEQLLNCSQSISELQSKLNLFTGGGAPVTNVSAVNVTTYDFTTRVQADETNSIHILDHDFCVPVPTTLCDNGYTTYYTKKMTLSDDTMTYSDTTTGWCTTEITVFCFDIL